MSERPEDGLCNKWGQSHEIPNLFISDGSQFSTSAAPNPTLTIVALTIRQPDYIADQMAKPAKWLVASESTSPWLYDWEHAGDPKN